MSTRSNDDDPHYLALLQLLRTAEEIWKASRAFFQRWDLSPSQFNVLNLLRLHPEGLSQTELSRFLVMHRSNLTGLIDQLESRGLARRRDATGDRRSYSVRLTPAGSRLLSEILPSYYDGARKVWGDLPERRAVQLRTTLARVAENVDRIAGDLGGAPTVHHGGGATVARRAEPTGRSN
jgi:DNA-binding MarR family transcriptional regulator